MPEKLVERKRPFEAAKQYERRMVSDGRLPADVAAAISLAREAGHTIVLKDFAADGLAALGRGEEHEAVEDVKAAMEAVASKRGSAVLLAKIAHVMGREPSGEGLKLAEAIVKNSGIRLRDTARIDSPYGEYGDPGNPVPLPVLVAARRKLRLHRVDFATKEGEHGPGVDTVVVHLGDLNVYRLIGLGKSAARA